MIKDFVLYLLVKHSKDHKLNQKKITSEIVNIWQCSVNKAERKFSQMENIGLKFCKKFDDDEFFYDDRVCVFV